jgi:hypothetical protein
VFVCVGLCVCVCACVFEYVCARLCAEDRESLSEMDIPRFNFYLDAEHGCGVPEQFRHKDP